MKTTKKIYRQGDVLLIPISELPSGLVKTKKVTLALGEVTGHHHTIFSGATGYASVGEDPNVALAEYLTIDSPTGADLVHQEHSTITIPTGTYKSVIQVEYSPEEIRKVAD